MRLTEAPSMLLPLCFITNVVMPHGGCPAAWVKASLWLASTLEYVHELFTHVPASKLSGPNAACAAAGAIRAQQSKAKPPAASEATLARTSDPMAI